MLKELENLRGKIESYKAANAAELATIDEALKNYDDAIALKSAAMQEAAARGDTETVKAEKEAKCRIEKAKQETIDDRKWKAVAIPVEETIYKETRQNAVIAVNAAALNAKNEIKAHCRAIAEIADRLRDETAGAAQMLDEWQRNFYFSRSFVNGCRVIPYYANSASSILENGEVIKKAERIRDIAL